jgi:hypothetical protein
MPALAETRRSILGSVLGSFLDLPCSALWPTAPGTPRLWLPPRRSKRPREGHREALTRRPFSIALPYIGRERALYTYTAIGRGGKPSAAHARGAACKRPLSLSCGARPDCYRSPTRTVSSNPGQPSTVTLSS